MIFLSLYLSAFFQNAYNSIIHYFIFCSFFAFFIYILNSGFTFSLKSEINFKNDYKELVIGTQPPILIRKVDQIKFLYLGERPEYKPLEKKRFKRNIRIDQMHNGIFVDNLLIDNRVVIFFSIRIPRRQSQLLQPHQSIQIKFF